MAILATALVAPTAASAQDLSRADPALRFLLMNRPAAEAPAADRRAPLPRPDAVSPSLPGLFDLALDASAGPLRVRTLVRLGPGGESALLRAGAIIGSRAGEIVTARIPLDAVPALLADPGIQAMEAATPLRPLYWAPAAHPTLPPPPVAMNDSANADAGFDRLRSRVGERWDGLTGAGVIVGIYDSGLDLEHDDFRQPDGGTRVLFAWDQSETGSGPGMLGEHSFTYGVECTAPAIDGGDCPMRDRGGHGTHVSGTAAGDGSATGLGQDPWRFPGGAPGADLIVVKGGETEFHADQLVDGVAYIFARAEALGRPAVVNVSLSSQAGPHDGTTLLEEALDALSGPGRIVVSGSGNAGDHRNTLPPAPNGPNHAEGRAGSGSSGVRIPPYSPAPGAVNDGVLLELWYGGSDSLAVTVTTPAGEAVTVATGDSATLRTAAGAIVVLNAVDGPAPSNGDHAALIGILDAEADTPPQPGLWKVRITPLAIHERGDYHLWLTGATFDADALTVLDGQTSNRYLVGVPASATRVLAAGAHVTRHQWLGVGGEPQSFPVQESLGDIAYFSSPGPRRDEVSKPDVTAPGKVLISSLSRDASLWDAFPWLIESDSVHVGLLGTSMASPQLAAAVAILLQLEPTLTPEQAREALRLSAATDAHMPATLPDPTWGAGKLDVAAAAERLRPGGLVEPGEALGLSENPVRSEALVISYPRPPRSLAVYTLIGERVRSFRVSEIGPLTTVWGLDTDEGGDVANGAYLLVVDVDGRRTVRKILVARP